MPFIGINYTNAVYHQRYTELRCRSARTDRDVGLPDDGRRSRRRVLRRACRLRRAPRIVDAVAGGVAAGAAIAVKPATALFLVGPALAFAYRAASSLPRASSRAWFPPCSRSWSGGSEGSGSCRSSALRAGGRWERRRTRRRRPRRRSRLLQVTIRNLSCGLHFDEHGPAARALLERRLLQWLVVAGMLALGRRSPRDFSSWAARSWPSSW